MIGIGGHLLLGQAALVCRETLNRFKDRLIRGFGFHNDLLSFGSRSPH